MKLYVMGSNKGYDITVREWHGDRYGQDMSMDIATDYIDGHDYKEMEILDLIDWFEEYCGGNGMMVDVKIVE